MLARCNCYIPQLNLVIREASKKWSMPIRGWKSALNRFMIEFEDRLTNYQ